MSWYSDKTMQDDIVVSTRIRLARNIKGFLFPSLITDEQLTEINKLVKEAIIGSNTPFAKSLKVISMKDIPENERYAMVERHIISKEFASKTDNRSIIISEDESICIMVGEEDHIRIQVILPGFQLEKAYDIAERVDTLLCEMLDIAFDEHLGFLTECPTNLGTGLRASVMLHLPVLDVSGQMQELSQSVNKIGFTVRGMYGEGSKALASLYQLSNQITLGISEKNAIDNLKVIAVQLAEKERKMRETIDKIKAEDICMRSLGVLKNARILDSREMMERLSEIKLGIGLSMLDADIKPMEILIEGQPYMIMKKYGEMSPEERDIQRAAAIRERLKEVM